MDAIELGETAGQRIGDGADFRAAHKRLDPIDGPRALGTKRLALQAQKRRQTVVESHIGLLRTEPGKDGCLLVSNDGTIAFAIGGTASGLFVEKRCCPSTGPRTSHAMLFRTKALFDRWCEVDPTRFDDPLLAEQLRRHGHEILSTNG